MHRKSSAVHKHQLQAAALCRCFQTTVSPCSLSKSIDPRQPGRVSLGNNGSIRNRHERNRKFQGSGPPGCCHNLVAIERIGNKRIRPTGPYLLLASKGTVNLQNSCPPQGSPRQGHKITALLNNNNPALTVKVRPIKDYGIITSGYHINPADHIGLGRIHNQAVSSMNIGGMRGNIAPAIADILCQSAKRTVHIAGAHAQICRQGTGKFDIYTTKGPRQRVVLGYSMLFRPNAYPHNPGRQNRLQAADQRSHGRVSCPQHGNQGKRPVQPVKSGGHHSGTPGQGVFCDPIMSNQTNPIQWSWRTMPRHHTVRRQTNFLRPALRRPRVKDP